ncbi:MAG TPA: metallopeptidase family protein [Anaerolineae bacterium]|nr:metallopeptidase family protein [Anaerolineae bacterium]HMR66017.1 metallopeptidase family protein [Anaerolineae bacterium]
MVELSAAEFEQLVVEALDELPDFFQQKLQNIEVLVAEWPTPAQLRSVGLRPGQLLLGLYHGIPLTKRSGAYNLVPPDTITIFQGPIERVCRSREQLVEQVKHTVKHEIAHHFGISDERLRELGAY